MIRSISRARTSREAGFALLSAMVLAILYFSLMELLLIDSSRALAEAQRFRARIVAATLAENGAELAAKQMIFGLYTNVTLQNAQGSMAGRMRRSPYEFEIDGEGVTSGVITQKATVRIEGRISGHQIKIDYTKHGQ